MQHETRKELQFWEIERGVMMEQRTKIIIALVTCITSIFIGLIASSFKRLNAGEVGIQYDVHQNKLGDGVLQEGLHAGPPGFTFITFPKVFKTIEYFWLKCLNQDGLFIKLNVQFQYKVNEKKIKNLLLRFRNHEGYAKVLRHIASSAIHDSCSKFNVTHILNERAKFREMIFNKITAKFTDMHGIVNDVQVNNIQRPEKYKTAIKEKESAKQNVDIALSERPRVITEAMTKLREAETQANIVIQAAETESRITRTKAKAEADAIRNVHLTEARIYKDMMSRQNLTVEGLISYLATRAIQSAAKPVYVGMDAPAKTKFP